MSVTDGAPPVLLSIGGADSGGCYGVTSDLRVWSHLGAHGTSAFTVVTAQNTRVISAVQPLAADLVAAQIEAVLGDFPVVGVKTGMLGRVELVELVAAFAAAGRLPNLVVDPVLVNRHDEAMFHGAVVDAYRDLLLVHATLVTPNRPEAALLGLLDGGPCPVLITGGRPTHHGPGPALVPVVPEVVPDELVDVLIDGGKRRYLTHPRVHTTNVAGSGDALAAAITFSLGCGRPLPDAVQAGIDLVLLGLRAGADLRLGGGPGPLDLRGLNEHAK